MNNSPNLETPSRLSSAVAAGGVRLTKQRQVLLDLIEAAEGHLQASDILRLAREKDPRIDRATVYRTLSLLKSMGVVEELDLLHLDGHEHYYELRDKTRHAHIGCLRCGTILEFQSALQNELLRDIERRTGCKVQTIKIEVAAICAECQRTGADGSKRAARTDARTAKRAPFTRNNHSSGIVTAE